MQIVVIGLNHRTAPVSLREKVSFDKDAQKTALLRMKDTRSLFETVLVSTCNRTEIYTLTTSTKAARDFVIRLLAQHSGLATEEIKDTLYTFEGPQAVQHAMEVACGLDSIVLGETQILGQVKEAVALAAEIGTIGSFLKQMFRYVVEVGKRAQSETMIGQAPVSVASAAIQLAEKIYGSLRGRSALILGAGTMARIAAEHLSAHGVSQLYIANRTLTNAEELVRRVEAKIVPWEQLQHFVGRVDVVVAATGAGRPIITENMWTSIRTGRHGRQTLLLDLAIPRNIDSSLSGHSDVFLYDVDDLQQVVDVNMEERRRQTRVVREMIDSSLLEFDEWISSLSVVPVITAIREKGVQIQSDVMESLKRKLPHLSEKEIQILQKHTMSIVNQLLRDPIHAMKDMAVQSDPAFSPEALAQLFGIEFISQPHPEREMLTSYKMSEFMGKWRSLMAEKMSGSTVGSSVYRS
ncbi:glutamyl-tRNA reductase [Alicyclobacillus tolerans]|uniref:Glutamyl-tRNA reductase n=1 Tax=Alicyclobacillus tolerans TaxID=90970 RepID=A0A1M6UQ41_9BACL|nr:glutamyl-tRNA reductase [Alicyclobacillus montanus]SHK71298.1 glutamyl-tRNA reductase [Alicyclobacillus montanus]